MHTTPLKPLSLDALEDTVTPYPLKQAADVDLAYDVTDAMRRAGGPVGVQVFVPVSRPGQPYELF